MARGVEVNCKQLIRLYLLFYMETVDEPVLNMVLCQKREHRFQERYSFLKNEKERMPSTEWQVSVIAK